MPISSKSFFGTIFQYSIDLLLQVLTISIIVFLGFVISFYLRQLDTGQVLFTDTIWLIIFRWSLLAGIIATIVYKFGRLTVFNVLSLFLPRSKTNNKPNRLVSTLFSLFVATAFIITTQPLRPILQHTQIDEKEPYIDVAYVKYDFVPTLIILLALAIPTTLLSKKKDSPPDFFTTIALILLLGGTALYSSLSPNFMARVYEARESWILRDWNNQSLRADKALKEATTPEEKATALYWLGVAANRNKEYQKAIEYQLEAITLQPNYGAPYSSISSAYRALGNYPLALDYAQKCIRRAADYAWCYYAMAATETETGEWDGAVKNFTRATQLDPHDQELKASLTDTVNHIEQMDSEDKVYASQLPPGCSSEYIVDALGQRCNGKNLAKRFSYTNSAHCLTISNTNCQGAGIQILNNCPTEQQVFFNNESIAKGETKTFQLAQPGNEMIVYGVGLVGDEYFTVSYTQTKNLCP